MRKLIAMSALVAAVYVPPARAASVDGVNIHWTSHGSGPQTLMLVHHLTANETSWSEQVTALSPRYRVITLDLPGHGRSGIASSFRWNRSCGQSRLSVLTLRRAAGAGRSWRKCSDHTQILADTP